MPGEEIVYLSVSELAKRIESKKLSPVDLTQAYLDRSQKLGPRPRHISTAAKSSGRDLTPTPAWRPRLPSNKPRQRKKKSSAATTVALCTGFPTPRKTCWQ